jgi:hypothetical protein
MKCKHQRIRTKKGFKYGYCTLNKKEVPIFGCKCNDNTYKEQTPIKKVSYRLSKKENNRFSTIYTLSNKCCCNCLKIGKIDKNEIYEGAKRTTSINNGFVAPFCRECHELFHNNRKFALRYKILFQLHYQLTHSLNDFINLIHYNYISAIGEEITMDEVIEWLKLQISLIRTREHFDLGMYEAYVNCLNKLIEMKKDTK